VLFIDLDTQGHCAVGLGVTVQRETPTVHNIFVTSGGTLRDSVVSTCVTGLTLSPANPFHNHGLGDNTFKLQQALKEENMATDYDFGYECIRPKASAPTELCWQWPLN